ncbi:MAG TPA: tyrosine-type recombinase/integrase [Bacteroidota bacterium]|nr:tyrosine-type recombinase/integrase [Bacteroidota bacterium]
MARSSHIRAGLPSGGLAPHRDGFLKSLGSKRPETRGTYGRALREFLRWHERKGIHGLTTGDVLRYKTYLATEKGLKPVSVSTYLTAVRRFCAYLVGRGLLPHNPALSVKGNRRPRAHSRAPLTAAEAEALLAGADRDGEQGARDFAFITLMLKCGLSEIEIIRADARDLLRLSGGAFLCVQGKGRVRKDQQVELTPDALAAIDEYLGHRKKVRETDPLFAGTGNRTRGTRMTTRGVRDRVSELIERAGLHSRARRRITPYSLRHTAAFLLAMEGASAEEIRSRMRFGSLSTAMLYIELAKERQNGH